MEIQNAALLKRTLRDFALWPCRGPFESPLTPQAVWVSAAGRFRAASSWPLTLAARPLAPSRLLAQSRLVAEFSPPPLRSAKAASSRPRPYPASPYGDAAGAGLGTSRGPRPGIHAPAVTLFCGRAGLPPVLPDWKGPRRDAGASVPLRADTVPPLRPAMSPP